jgi:hypothetical protein
LAVALIVLFLPNAIILLVWTTQDPLVWLRSAVRLDNDGFIVEAVSGCHGNNTTSYVALLIAYNVIIMLLGSHIMLTMPQRVGLA